MFRKHMINLENAKNSLELSYVSGYPQWFKEEFASPTVAFDKHLDTMRLLCVTPDMVKGF